MHSSLAAFTTLAEPPTTCPSAHRTPADTCNLFDNNPRKCEESVSRRLLQVRVSQGFADCWYYDGRCRAFHHWRQKPGAFGWVLAGLDARGCTESLVLPPGVPRADQVLRDVSVRCGTMDGWLPIGKCARVAQEDACQRPAASPTHIRTLQGFRPVYIRDCKLMTLVDGQRQCYTREPSPTVLPKWHKDALNSKETRVCGEDPCDDSTAKVVREYLERWSSNQTNTTSRCTIATGATSASASPRLLLIVDKACNGCSKTVSGSSNLWHRMSRMFTVWQALKALGCARASLGDQECSDAELPVADVLFTRRHSYLVFPNSSRSGWSTLVGGRVLNPHTWCRSCKVKEWDQPYKVPWCSYDKLVILPYAPKIVTENQEFRDSDGKGSGVADTLWSLSFGRHFACASSEAGYVWRAFVRDMLTRMNLRHMLWPHHTLHEPSRTEVCLLLRSDPNKPAGRTWTWNKAHREFPRYEAANCVHEMHQTLGGICRGHQRVQTRDILFQSATTLRHQVSQMEGCNVAMGIHGAQLMNVMWMQHGSAVVEFHRISVQDTSSPSGHESQAEKEMVYYYRNVAILSGHTYFSREVCDNRTNRYDRTRKEYAHCAGQATGKGIHLYSDQVQQVAMAAVASIGHMGGAYDDRPVRACPYWVPGNSSGNASLS